MEKAKKRQQSQPRYQRAQLGPQAGRGPWSGFIMGLGAITMLGSPSFNPPKYSGEGIGGDWRAVGDQLRGAMRRYDERQKA